MADEEFDYEDDDFDVFDEDDDYEDDVVDESDEDADEDDEDDEDRKEVAEEAPPEEEPEPAEPDNRDAIQALRSLGARVDINNKDRAWRVFLYHRHKDEVLDQIHGLPCLEQIWLLGSRVTSVGAKKLQERLGDKVTIYS